MALDHELLQAALPRYDIGEEIGRGGWGIVLRGHHRELGRDVAIKQLPRAFGADPSVRDRFIHEARLVASLDHPHIVPVFDFVDHEGLLVIVMELATGGTLWDRFSDQGLETDQAVGTVLAAAVGLHHAHTKGVFHRDVKPENVLFSASGTAKIADFGIAKAIGEEASARTATGSIVGTPAYMAPEQVTGDELSPATDVYALGIVLYELLTGQLPYRPVTEAVAQLFQHVNDEPRDMAAIREGVAPELEAVTRRALAKDPGDRPRSAEEFAVDLAEAATAALGAGWLARSGVAVMSATSVVAATERGAPAPQGDDDPASRRAGTIMVKAHQSHDRLGAVASSGGVAPPPRSSGEPPAAPPPPPPSSDAPAAASPPPSSGADQPAAVQPAANSDPARRSGVLIGAGVAVVAVVVLAVFALSGSGGGDGEPDAATSTTSPTTITADEISASEISRFEDLCTDRGVSDERCRCAADRAVSRLTVAQFRDNLVLMGGSEGAITDPVLEIFQSCEDDGF